MKALVLAVFFALPSLIVKAQECYDLGSRSEWIGVVCYENGSMNVQMQGSTYNFCNVPSNIFKGLVNATSPGTYYDQHIRGRYRCSGY